MFDHADQVKRCMQAVKSILVAVLFLAPSFSIANDEFLEMMVQGKYILIGKALDSDDTYRGKVEISSSHRGLVVNRTINGASVSGRAAIEAAVGGDARVLRIRFEQDGKSYEQTCMVGSDLDNYARISCYLYVPGRKTMNPGMEVLFIDHNAN